MIRKLRMKMLGIDTIVVITALLIILAELILAGLAISHIVPIIKSAGYECEGNAVVDDIEYYRVFAGAVPYTECKVYYTYNIDGTEYAEESSWIGCSSDENRMRIGSELKLRYEQGHPEMAILEDDRKNHIARLIVAILSMAVVYVMTRWI